MSECPFCKIPCGHPHCPYTKNDKEKPMKIFVATITELDEQTTIVGAYSSFDVAMAKIEEAMDELQEKNEDLGVYSNIVEVDLDDIDDDKYI
jgi:hypothetical protein